MAELHPPHALLLAKLRSAHEALCVAQTICVVDQIPILWDHQRAALGDALATIERIGIYHLGSSWSSYRLPSVQDPDEVDEVQHG